MLFIWNIYRLIHGHFHIGLRRSRGPYWPGSIWASIWKWSCSNPITGYFPGVWKYGQFTDGTLKVFCLLLFFVCYFYIFFFCIVLFLYRLQHISSLCTDRNILTLVLSCSWENMNIVKKLKVLLIGEWVRTF